jgi:hypothetical protein
MMQDIYKQARAVFIWLGPMPPGYDQDPVDLQALQAINAPWQTHMGMPVYKVEDIPAYDAWLAENLGDRAFDALAEFLQIPWFRRVWIIQELLCAKHVVIWRGIMVMDPNTILSGAGSILNLHHVNIRLQIGAKGLANRLHITCAGRLEQLRQGVARGEQIPMIALLLATHSFQATDRRDKIFALVGLASDMDERFVDYSKDIKQVVTELSRMFLTGKLLNFSSPLDVLTYITRPDGEHEDLPSWVTEWTLRSDSSLFTSLVTAYPTKAPFVTDEPILHFEDEKVCIVLARLLLPVLQLYRRFASAALSLRKSRTLSSRRLACPSKYPLTMFSL